MSLRHYPAYKDSGVKWLGQVPEHWNVVAIKRLCETITDGAHISPETETGVFPFVSTKDVNDDTIDMENCLRTSESSYEYMVKAGCRPLLGDVLFSKDGTIGRTVVVKEDRDFVVASSLIIIRPNKSHIDPHFLNRLCQSSLVSSQVDSLVKGAGLPRLSIHNLLKVIGCFPPLAEQTQIAAFLDRETAKIDALVAEQRRLVELLNEKRQAVISHAVTRGLNPQASMKSSGVEWLGEVPEHWKVIALKRIADVRTGVAKGKDNSSRATIMVPYLRVANVQDGYLDLDNVATIEIPAGDLERYVLKPGDVLMNEGGDFDKLGRGHVWEGQIHPCITQNHVFAVRPRAVSAAWLNAITGSDYAKYYFMTRSKQSTNLASISSTNLMELPVVLPPVVEQDVVLSFVASHTSRFDILINESQRAIDLLQERRTALISAAVTGQIDVRPLEGKRSA